MAAPGETVVLVPGLWSTGLEMRRLGQRLDAAGFQTLQFTYSSMRNTPFENAMQLHEFMLRLDTPVCHLVGHSLGGVVIHHRQHHFPDGKAGRVVTLGTPFNGSSAARSLARVTAGRLILGRSLMHGLLSAMRPWHCSRQLGSIAGSRRLGLGLLVPGVVQPSDGTVAIEETRIQGMQDHIVVSATHMSLLTSAEVSRQVQNFLTHGVFAGHDGAPLGGTGAK